MKKGLGEKGGDRVGAGGGGVDEREGDEYRQIREQGGCWWW